MARLHRRNQQTLDFIEEIRKQLGDDRPKSFGIYMKIYKDFGKEKMSWAARETIRRNPTDKFRYFLGIFWKMKENKEVLQQYKKLRASLVKQMTPPILRSARKRSRFQVKIARQERRARRRIKN